MLLDKWLSFEQKVWISVVSAGLWAYGFTFVPPRATK